MSKTRGPTGSGNKGEVCPDYDKNNKKVSDRETGLQCEICEIWFHAKCQTVPEETYKLMQHESIHWFCYGCNKGIGKVIQSLAGLQARQDQLETRQQDMEIKVQELEQTVGEPQMKSHRQMKANLAEETLVKSSERSWVDIVAQEVEKKIR